MGPVCCDGKTYGNKCTAECELEETGQCTAGECPKPCLCTKEYDPVCCDGKTYGNTCTAECELEETGQCTAGECPKLRPWSRLIGKVSIVFACSLLVIVSHII